MEEAVNILRSQMLLADRNVYGIDLNPVAVELAEVSLWLNSIYKPEDKGAFVPWFGMHLHCGNSLIGARRQVYDSALLPIVGKKRKQKKLWYELEPERVQLPETIKPGYIYHFLLPDYGMAEYKDKVIKGLAPGEIKQINDWRKAMCKEPWLEGEVDQLVVLSRRIDELWLRHADELAALKKRTTDSLDVWGQPEEIPKKVSLAMKDKIHAQEKLSEGVSHSGAYRRLKLVMDYWCALWFWPIMKAELLPTRQEYLLELALILGEMELAQMQGEGQQEMPLFPETGAESAREFAEKYGRVSVRELCEMRPRLGLVEQLAAEKRFFHWELEFADVFVEKGGFDLFLGNPPWIKVEWKEGGVLGDYNPLVDLRKLSASQLAKERAKLFEENKELEKSFFNEYETSDGVQSFLNGYQNYSLLKGMQTNLFKCFLPQAWSFSKEAGTSGFLHPEGVYDDPKGGKLRQELYGRLRYHFQFQNEFALFTGTNDHGRMRFGLHVYGLSRSEPDFYSISNLFAPNTIDRCFEPSKLPVPGIKNDEDNWNTLGHPSRAIEITSERLSLFATLYDDSEMLPASARLPNLHADSLIPVLEKFASQTQKLGNLENEYCATVMFDETNSIKKDHIIRRDTQFVDSPENLILSGPHFYQQFQIPIYGHQKAC